MSKSRNGILGLLTFIFGLLFGGITALLLSTNEQGETKKPVKNRVKEVKLSLKEISDKDRLKEAKTVITQKLTSIKQSLQSIDKAKYQSLVDEVIGDFKKEGAMTAAQLKKVAAYLQADYQQLVAANLKKSAKPKKS